MTERDQKQDRRLRELENQILALLSDYPHLAAKHLLRETIEVLRDERAALARRSD